jgi:hypothetical protein
MALIAVLLPLAMLGIVLALSRYEDLLLPPQEETPRSEGASQSRPLITAQRDGTGTGTPIPREERGPGPEGGAVFL